MSIRYNQLAHIVPLVSPVDTAATAVQSPYVDLKDQHWATFLAFFGTITGDTCDVTMQASTAASSNATESEFAFTYRLSSAINTDSWGAVTTADTAGVGIAASDDDKILAIEVDPATVAAIGADFRYVRLVATPGGSMSACEIAVLAVTEPRYPRSSQLSTS